MKRVLTKLAVLTALAVFAIGAENTPKGLSKERTVLLNDRGMAQYRELAPMNVDELSRYDFASIFGEQDGFGCYLAYIGDNFQRLHIVFDEIAKIAPLKYAAKGQTMVKGNYNDFGGEITIDKAYRYKEFSEGLDGEMIGKIADQGVIFAKVTLRENDKQKGSGVFKGDLMTTWYIDADKTLRYDDIDSHSDNYANNQFLGVWTSYKTSAQKRVAWGQARIPQSRGFDIGAGDFSVDRKYLKNGWNEHDLCGGVTWRKK
ncbi:MAG: hypothetical protein LBO72_06800 [Helicobacteraceae bacterium]|jgi:hypothetical protein|nr:hypothetical protein [Helicobacteraceae bacterium]